jgi:hypothetical protein
VTCVSEEIGRLELEGGNNTATRRTSSIAISGYRLDAEAGTYQA